MSSTVEPLRPVLVVDREEHSGALLVQYLEARGWRAELVSDPRRVIRQWVRSMHEAPMIVLKIDDDDPDAFELLAALSAHALEARVVVCARRDLDLNAVRVDRALPQHCRFSAVAKALDDLEKGFVLRDAAE